MKKAQKSHFKHPVGLSGFMFTRGLSDQSIPKRGKAVLAQNPPEGRLPITVTHTQDDSGFISAFASHFGKSLGFPGWISGRSAKI